MPPARPVFDVDFDSAREAGGRYPDVWITVQQWPPTPTRTGRNCVGHYSPDGDEGGWDALNLGGRYYDEGMGCVADPGEAFRWFREAYELGQRERPVIWGSAALRLGQACEEGEGCEQSFEEARTWYERAETGLEIAVRGGDSWYRGALRRAHDGLARVKQELSGDY